MVNEFVLITDLDRTYTAATHPKLEQVEKFIISANQLLMTWKGQNSNVSISTGGFKQVGIKLTENFIWNEKVKDNLPGYKFNKPEFITQDMKDILIQSHPFTEMFSWNPGSSNSGFI